LQQTLILGIQSYPLLFGESLRQGLATSHVL